MKRLCVFLASLLLVGISFAQAQTVRITGTVTSSEDGAPIPGVSVIVKGTTIGVTTDVDGKYTLSNVPQNAEVIVFSFVGLKTIEMPATQSVINVVMESDSKELAEVVITGVGVATDKRKVAISVESVSEGALKKVPNKSLDGALVGRIAGAQIQSTSGQPGQQANIILRGINSLSGTQPMILIDGVEVNASNTSFGTGNVSSRLSDLDLSNVERVEVIQGAAAATIYGAQGANGVIQIFTKKGRAGQKTDITFNSSLSIDNALRGNIAKAKYHYFPTTAAGFIDDGTGTPIAVDSATGYWTKPDETITANTLNNKPYKEAVYDHLDQYFNSNVVTQSHSLNIVGASEKMDYAVGLSVLDQESPVHGSYDKKNLSVNLGAELFKGFKLRSTTQLVSSTNTTGGVNNRNNIFSGLSQALTTPSFVDLTFKDELGNPFVNWDRDDNGVMPFYSYKYRSYLAKVNRIIQGINANYKINRFVEVDYKYGVDHYRYDNTNFIANQRYTMTPGKGIDSKDGELEKNRIQETQQNSLLSVFFKFDFAKDFNLDIPLQSTTHVAYDWRKSEYGRVTGKGNGYAVDPPFTLSTAQTKNAEEYIQEFVTFGYLVNQKFDYGTLAGLSFGFRSDYSSAFGEGSKPFTFPRADFYFRPSELIKKDFLYDLKIRAAYGEAGIQPNAYDRLITLSSYTLGDQSYFYLPVISRNTALEVEKTKETEVGLDYGISLAEGAWLNKLSGSVVYWTRKSIGSIYQVDTPPSTGQLAVTTNAIDLSSTGLQLAMDLNVYTSKNFEWTFGTRFSKGKTTVDKIANHLPIIIGSGGSGQTSIVEGQPVGAFYGVKPLSSLDEVDSNGDRYIDDADVANYEIVNGMVVHTASKTVQFTSEQTKIGDATPDFTLSFFNDFTIMKNLTLSVQIDWVYGAEAYNASRQWMYRDRIHSDFDKEITIGGQSGAWVAYYNSLYNTNAVNKYFVEDASFIRLRSLSLSYDFGGLVKSRYIKGLVLTASGRNLFTITDYSGIDPEAVGTSINNPLYRGIDLWSFPNMRTFSFGLTANF